MKFGEKNTHSCVFQRAQITLVFRTRDILIRGLWKTHTCVLPIYKLYSDKMIQNLPQLACTETAKLSKSYKWAESLGGQNVPCSSSISFQKLRREGRQKRYQAWATVKTWKANWRCEGLRKDKEVNSTIELKCLWTSVKIMKNINLQLFHNSLSS